MLRGRKNLDRRQWVISFLLVALVARSLVPVGYMPSAGNAFHLEICPEGLPPEILAIVQPSHHHHHHDGSPGAPHEHDPYRNEHCAFAAASGMGPAPHGCEGLAQVSESRAPPVAVAVSLPENRRFRIAQPRAPPVPA